MNFEKYEAEFDGSFFCMKELLEDSSEEKSEGIPDAKVLENAQKEFEVTLVNLRKAAHKVADWNRLPSNMSLRKMRCLLQNTTPFSRKARSQNPRPELQWGSSLRRLRIAA